MEIFCKQLKKSREKSGLSQAAVSKKLGYKSPQFVSNWERSLILPPIKTIFILSKLYKDKSLKKYLLQYYERRINSNWSD